MLFLYNKIIGYGIKRALVLFIIKINMGIKKYFYYYIFSENKAVCRMASIIQPVQFVGKGRIEVDKTARIGVWPSPDLLSSYTYIEARGANAVVKIGRRTHINNKLTIIADKTSVTIGDDCLIGQSVSIFDSDFHGLKVENRNNGNYDCSAVVIGNNVFLGSNVTILKGVYVGDGAVVGSGSVLINDVPSMTIFAGVPAKFIRKIG